MLLKLIKKHIDLFVYIILFLIGILTRAPLIEKVQSQWDGPQYAIAILHYSLAQSTPTFPGYPFYIAIGKFFYLFLHDPQKAILAVSIFGSAVGAVIIYFVGGKMYHRFVGFAASIIFLTGSTFYYFGLTAYAYILTPVTTVILAYVVYRIVVKDKQEGFFLGTALGASIGVRPQEAPQILLLFLLGFLFLKNSEKVKSILLFSLITLLWLIPVINTVGLEEYFKFFVGLKQYNIYAPILQNIQMMTKGFLLSFGLSFIFLFYFVFKYRKSLTKSLYKNSKIIIFYLVWIIPGLLINLLLRSDHAGYQMTYLSGFLILISYSIWKVTEKRKIFYILILLVIATFNLYWFFYDRDPNFVKPYRPTSFHYSDIRKNDLKTGSKIQFISSRYKPDKTLVITLSVLWRPYSYYLKNYNVINLNGLEDKNPETSYIQRDVKNWHMKESRNKDLFLLIPSGITTVVFPDDNAYTWIKKYPFKTYILPGNSMVTSISVTPKTKIKYNFNSLQIIQ